MVRPYQRTNSMAKKKKVTPGHRYSIIYRRRRPKKAKCAICGVQLSGVPNLRPSKMKNLPKTYKRPERQYGGRVCPKCLKKALIKEASSL
ncbi:MAG: 50S ribosomal protein L34e [Promethearchaeota archaeon]